MNLPDVADLSWQNQAQCGDRDTELFFPEAGTAKGQKARAKAVCRACPVQEECLDYALTVPLILGGWVKGIWAATTSNERIQLREERGL